MITRFVEISSDGAAFSVKRLRLLLMASDEFRLVSQAGQGHGQPVADRPAAVARPDTTDTD